MNTILVVYGTTEGQTKKIAEFIIGALKARGADVELLDSDSEAAAVVPPIYAAAIVCGSLHDNRYQASLREFIKDNTAWLSGIPAAFVGVSLSAALSDTGSRKELLEATENLYRETHWAPGMTFHVAGALRHTHFRHPKRSLLRRLAAQESGGSPAVREREYTNWNSLTACVDEFLGAISP